VNTNNKLFYTDLVTPKDEWIYRRENNYVLAANPRRSIIKKIRYLTDKKQPNYKIIENPKVKNSLSAPVKIFVDVTTRCNLQCLHCLSSSGNSSFDLSMDVIKEIFRWAKKRGVFQVKIGGGEPVLHPNFWEIVDLANKSNLLVSISTNGCLVDQVNADALKFLGVKVTVSLDGNRKNHDKLRGAGVFDKAIKCIELLINKGVPTSIGTTLMNGKVFSNFKDIPFLVSLSKKYNIQIKVRRAKPCGRANTNLLALINPNKDYWRTIDWLNRQKEKGVKVNLEDIMDYSEDCTDKIFIEDFDCGAGTRGLHINSFGVVSPCVFLGEEFEAGKITSSRELDEIWMNSEKFSILRTVKLNPNINCRNCRRRTKCGGECRAVAFASSGEINGRDPCCPLNRGRK